jgi:CRP-like cAMP-binding protein
MIKLLKLATWESAEAGERFVERDKPLNRLIVIYSGKACAEVDGRNVTELQPGQFIGSISYVTEETAPANVVAIEPTRYVSWPKSKLKDFMNKNPDLHSALKSTLAIDLTRWLQATWARGTSQNATRTDHGRQSRERTTEREDGADGRPTVSGSAQAATRGARPSSRGEEASRPSSCA